MLLHALTHTHPCAHTHTCTHTHTNTDILHESGFKKPGTYLVQQLSCDHNKLYWYHYSQYWLCTKHTGILQSSNVRVWYMHAMLSFNNTNHHLSDAPSKRLGGVLWYVHMFVIYHVQSTVYCPFKYLGYSVFSNPYLSVCLWREGSTVP